MDPNVVSREHNHTFIIDAASLQPGSTEVANAGTVPRRPPEKRHGKKISYRQALYDGSWQEGINSPKGNLKRVQSDVDELDRLEYSGESLRSGVTLHVIAKRQRQKRKNSIPVMLA